MSTNDDLEVRGHEVSVTTLHSEGGTGARHRSGQTCVRVLLDDWLHVYEIEMRSAVETAVYDAVLRAMRGHGD